MAGQNSLLGVHPGQQLKSNIKGSQNGNNAFNALCPSPTAMPNGSNNSVVPMEVASSFCSKDGLKAQAHSISPYPMAIGPFEPKLPLTSSGPKLGMGVLEAQGSLVPSLATLSKPDSLDRFRHKRNRKKKKPYDNPTKQRDNKLLPFLNFPKISPSLLASSQVSSSKPVLPIIVDGFLPPGNGALEVSIGEGRTNRPGFPPNHEDVKGCKTGMESPPAQLVTIGSCEELEFDSPHSEANKKPTSSFQGIVINPRSDSNRNSPLNDQKDHGTTGDSNLPSDSRDAEHSSHSNLRKNLRDLYPRPL